MMSPISRLLIWYGGTIIALLYLAGAMVWAADAYKYGVGPLIVALVIVSAAPAIVLGLVLDERKFWKGLRR